MASSASVGEGGGSIQIAVERHLGSTGTVSVSFATSNGTATSGTDFTSTSGTLTWADGDIAPRTITIPILQDAVVEGKETFSIVLSSPTGGATLGTLSTLTVTIVDDEPDSFPPTAALPPGFISPNNPPVPAQTNTPTTVWSFEPNDGYLSNTSLRSAQVYSASGDFTNYRNSDMEFTGQFLAGNITFAYRVSSYSTTYGVLEFMVDDVVVFTSAGGETGWQTVSRAVTAGAHTLRWRFKNRLPFACAGANPAPPGGSNCADRAWVDAVVLPLVVSPGAPTGIGVSAGPGSGVVTVSFTAPASNGGAAITSYTASCSASGQTTRTNTGSSSPIVVSGLTNGVSYTCTVTATNSVGTGSASAASSSVTPTSGVAKPYD
jgi:hypothetical protein